MKRSRDEAFTSSPLKGPAIASPIEPECHSKRDMPRLYPHAKGILYALKDKGVSLAIASRSPTPDIANTFLEKLGIKSMVVAQAFLLGKDPYSLSSLSLLCLVAMIMFSTFEYSVDLMYHKIIQRKREDCSTSQQLAVTCLAGYVAGAVGTVISNPADNIVSSLYNKKVASVMQAIKNIGLANLFTRSLPVRITIVGPVIMLQWFFYDSIKVLSGLPTSGGLSRHLNDAELLGYQATP